MRDHIFSRASSLVVVSARKSKGKEYIENVLLFPDTLGHLVEAVDHDGAHSQYQGRASETVGGKVALEWIMMLAFYALSAMM